MSGGRALVVTPQLPWPLDDGGRIGLWQMLWSVGSGYDTTLVSLVPAGSEGAPLPAPLANLAAEVVRIPHAPPPRPVALFHGLAGRWPYTLARYRNARLDAALRRLTVERRPAFVLLNHLHLATYLDACSGAPVVIREHNVEFLWLERYAATVMNPLARAYVRQQAWRMRRAEGDLCRQADLVLAIHDEEARLLRAIAPRARVETVPVGIDFGRFDPHAPEFPPIVLLVGSYRWRPNVAGALRFLRDGWPRVRRRMPAACLRVVGQDLPRELAAAARSVGAEPVGYVESIAAEFARASVMVVPLWAGAGTRVKIVEGLAAGVPIVSTSLGAEGLGLRPGEHFLGAETPEAMGEAVADLLASPARAESLARAGQAYVRASFSLEAVARRVIELCSSLTPSVRRSPAFRDTAHA